MPQPLSRVRPDAGIRLGNVGDYPLARHPDLALLAAEVIASWANVEGFMLNLFIQMMGGPTERAATVFISLETQTAKTQAIQAVARSLPREQQEILRVILALAKTQQRARDKIAHWTWGDADSLPDALLLVDPRANAVAVDGLPNYDDIYVYREQDFREIIRGNERVARFAMQLRFILEGHIANQDGALFARLCAEPEIQEKLNRQA